MPRRSAKGKGADAEDRCVAALEADGYQAWRTHRSLGPFDVFAVNTGMVRFVQVKAFSTKNPSFAGRKVRAELQAVPHPPNTSIELWVWNIKKNEWHSQISV